MVAAALREHAHTGMALTDDSDSIGCISPISVQASESALELAI
jgi:hypothetical protein